MKSINGWEQIVYKLSETDTVLVIPFDRSSAGKKMSITPEKHELDPTGDISFCCRGMGLVPAIRTRIYDISGGEATMVGLAEFPYDKVRAKATPVLRPQPWAGQTSECPHGRDTFEGG